MEATSFGIYSCGGAVSRMFPWQRGTAIALHYHECYRRCRGLAALARTQAGLCNGGPSSFSSLRFMLRSWADSWRKFLIVASGSGTPRVFMA